MGVMLSLDRHGPARGHRRAQHARREDGLARARALASMRRCEAPASAGLLGRLARALLPWRNRSAASGRPRDGRGERALARYPGLSVACLLGECQDGAGGQGCDVGTCEHDCHRGAAAPGDGRGAGRAPAA
jgi:hypothetical protein